MSGNRVGESSESIRQRVQAARDIQNKRFTNGKTTDIVSNADMRIGEIRKFCQLQDEGQSLMRAAMSQLNLSARAYHRVLKLARTISDLMKLLWENRLLHNIAVRPSLEKIVDAHELVERGGVSGNVVLEVV